MGRDRRPSRKPAATTVVVLAAGRGSRLAPFTDALPKCLVPVGGTSPLESLLAALEDRPVKELVMVVGHARDEIESFLAGRRLPFPVELVFNPRFDSANNIVSAALAAPRAAGGFLLVNSDVLCHPRLLADALAAAAGSFLVVDPTRPPRAEAMKVRYAEGALTDIGKGLDPREADGEYVGIARFDSAGAGAFFACVEAILDRGGQGEWYEAAIGEAARLVPIGMRGTGGAPWIEIDDPLDLERAVRDVVPHLGPRQRRRSK